MRYPFALDLRLDLNPVLLGILHGTRSWEAGWPIGVSLSG
jgi:hypothetical protein